MWSINKIKAQNICAFEEFEYTLNQNVSTLIFGDNKDDASQNSNGSGKSGFLEPFSVALTGETLRKVNMDEIINDMADEAQIDIYLSNTNGDDMEIHRTLFRKKAQQVSVILNNEPVAQASVNDYNKFILDTIGLTKDEVFANFILTRNKYKSFLNSSDREKKEIINGFSNGVMVDESIETLNKDIEDANNDFIEAEKSVSEYEGRVSALEEEINRAIQESADRSANKKARIERWNKAIADKRAEIRKINEDIDAQDEKIRSVNLAYQDIVDVENSNKSLEDCFDAINKSCKKHNVSVDIASYISAFEEYNRQLDTIGSDISKTDALYKDSLTYLDELQQALNNISKRVQAKIPKMDEEYKQLIEKASEIEQAIHDCNEDKDTYTDQRLDLMDRISDLKNKLSGVIQCPNCKHEFVLDSDIDVNKARKEIDVLKCDVNKVSDKIEKQVAEINKLRGGIKTNEEDQFNIRAQKSMLNKELTDAQNKFHTYKNETDKLASKVSDIQNKYDKINSLLSHLSEDMFDDVFEQIDGIILSGENAIDNYKIDISNCKGVIKSYKESIAEIENAAETDVTESLRESKKKNEKQLKKIAKEKDEKEALLNELKKQESYFTDFKTHLANTKIDAISKITNDFLEAIGSDIRISLSGYTKLKSGKIRDKISVGLLRNGIDAGSFFKFSEGEKARVELACILAMRKLVNDNCDTGKGLNLLIIDEILDSTDEQGLANVFSALNDTQSTSLVVSHGKIAENYQNKLVVHKENGISFI